MRISSFTVIVTVITLVLLGFSAGWLVFHQPTEELSRQEAITTEAPLPPPTAELDMPQEDVPGAELPGLPRYPGSVRTEYRREKVGDLIVTEAEYLIGGDADPVREFYRNVFRRNAWSVGDLGFSRGEWVFFVIRKEREALIEIEKREKVVEIELELSEPSPSPTEQKPGGSGNSPAAQPNPTPAVPAQPPVYDDGYEDQDDDLEEDGYPEVDD